MPDDRVDPKQLAIRIPVVAPRIRAAIQHDLKFSRAGVIAENAAVHPRAILSRSAGRADGRGVRDAVASVEPAIRPPAKAVHDVVADGLEIKPVEQHLRRAIGLVVAIFVRDENQIRRAQRIHAAIAEFDARESHALIPENRPLVEMPVIVRVLEDHDAVAQTRIPARGILGVSVALRDPQPPARIPRHRDRLLHIGLRREDLAGKSRRQFHRARHFRRRHRAAGRFLGIEDRREFRVRVVHAAAQQKGRRHEWGKEASIHRREINGPGWKMCASQRTSPEG